MQARAGDAAEPEAVLRTRFLLALRAWRAAHQGTAVLEGAFAADAARCLPECRPDVIIDCYYRHEYTMLYDR